MVFSSKTEENIKKLLDEHSNSLLIKNMNKLNTRVHKIFLTGVIIGIILSYTGLVGFIAGAIAGAMITNNYNTFTENIEEHIPRNWKDTLWLYYEIYIKKEIDTDK